ncbi:unnamed protein product [Auanema sp. JU1783]|nr:unnamed protein product [Auanema sp. JU1783]
MKKEGKRLKKVVKSNDPLDDKRFEHVRSDPKFAHIKTADRKIVIEKRFSGLLSDERFANSSTVDKRGKPIRRKKNNLNSLYAVESDGEEEAEQLGLKTKEEKKLKKKKTVVPTKKAKEESEESAEDVKDSTDSDDSDEPVRIDLARGDGNISSSDDDESSEDSEWDMPDDVAQQMDVAMLDNNCEQVEWASRRLAVCNLDWDVVKAEDIFILVNSFVQTGGEVFNVGIYLSDFGKEKMDVEENLGPQLNLEKIGDDEEYDANDRKVIFAVRKYNLEKLKYYYAVIECDSETTATKIYENCDGVLFENSGLKMDLRFVPDDMEFDQERLKEQLKQSDLNLMRYRPKADFESVVTRVGQDVQWDDADFERSKIVQEAFDYEETERNDMIADSDSEDDNAREQRKKALLSLIADKPRTESLKIEWDGEDQDTSDSDDSDIEKALAKRSANGENSDDESASEALEAEKTQPKKNGYRAYMEKAKEKRKEKKLRIREAKHQGVAQEIGEPQKKKRAQTRADLKQSDYGTAASVLADDRFNALITDSAFTIEQTNKHSKGTKLIELQVQAKKSIVPVAKKEESLVESLKSKSAKWSSKKRK